jgi:hypothetical protein
MIAKLVFMFFCFFVLSCTTIKYVGEDTNCLPNAPVWKTYFETLALRDLMLRVDSLSFKGVSQRKFGTKLVNFSCYEVFVKMNKELSGGVVYDPSRKPSYSSQDIQIDISISDTLDSSTLKALQENEQFNNLEKGYVQKNNFLSINNYENRGAYILINLQSGRAYKLEQNEENLKFHNFSLGEFVRYGCYQGIKFVGKEGVFSFGDYLMN